MIDNTIMNNNMKMFGERKAFSLNGLRLCMEYSFIQSLTFKPLNSISYSRGHRATGLKKWCQTNEPYYVRTFTTLHCGF